eukprot:s2486_g2.t1
MEILGRSWLGFAAPKVCFKGFLGTTKQVGLETIFGAPKVYPLLAVPRRSLEEAGLGLQRPKFVWTGFAETTKQVGLEKLFGAPKVYPPPTVPWRSLEEAGLGLQRPKFVWTGFAETTKQDQFSYCALLHEAASHGAWREALNFLPHTQSDGAVYGAAAYACQESGEWRETEQKQRCDTIAFNSIISACDQALEWMQSIHSLHHCYMTGLSGTTASYTSAMSSCGQIAGEWRRSLRFVQEMDLKQLKCSSVSQNAAISGTEWLQAFRLMMEFDRRHLQRDAFSYSASISSCRCHWTQALDLLFEAERAQIEQNCIMYNACISACEEAGEWQQVLELLLDAQERQLQLDAITFNAAISACAKGERNRHHHYERKNMIM